MASPSKSYLQTVPSDVPSEQEPRLGTAEMSLFIHGTTESPLHQPSPHSAGNQQSTFALATAVYTTSGGPTFQIPAPYLLQQPQFQPAHQELVAHTSPISTLPSWQGRQQSPLLVPGRAPTATRTRIMVPPSTGSLNNAQSQHSHSVTWPPLQHVLRPLTAAEQQLVVQNLTAPANVGGNLGTPRQIPSTSPLTQRSMDSLEVPGNSQLQRALLPASSPETQQAISPTLRPTGGAPFCSTPQKQYTNGRSVPDSSSCPASPLKPSLSAHDQGVQQFPLRTPTILCRHLTSPDGRHVHLVNTAPPARRDGVARDLAPLFSKETQSISGRKRTAAKKEASKVNTSTTVYKQDGPSHQPRRLEREHTHQGPADTQRPQDVPASDHSDVLRAVTEQLARSSPQGMQLLRGLCRTLEALEEALPSLERVRSCIQDLRQSLTAVASELGDAERLQTSRSVDEPGGSAREATPHPALQHQPLRTEGLTGFSPQNAALPQISCSRLDTLLHPSAVSTAVNQCSSIFTPEGDVAQPMSLPEEGSSRAEGSGKARVKSAYTTGAQFGPPASLPTEATATHIPSDKQVTEGTTVELSKEKEMKIPASVPWHGKMEEAERPEYYSPPGVGHRASLKKPRKSDKSTSDPQVHPNSSNASPSPSEGYTFSSSGETASESYGGAASEAARKFWLESNENGPSGTLTLQGLCEKHYNLLKLQQEIANNVRRNEIPQAQESKPNVSRILFDVSTPDRETDVAPVKRSRPASEPTGDIDLCTLSKMNKEQGVPESDGTGNEQRFMRAQGDETTGSGPYNARATILTQAEKSYSEAAKQEWLRDEAGLRSHGMNISGSPPCAQGVQEPKDSTERYVKSNGECMYSTRTLPVDAQGGREGGQNVQAPHWEDPEILSVTPEHPVVSPPVEDSAVPQRTERPQTESDTSVSADSSISQATDEPTAEAGYEVSRTLTTELRTTTGRRERKQKKPKFRGHYPQ